MVMLAVISCCVLFGVWKGMAWQLAALAALVLSAVVASRYSGALAPHIKISSEPVWNLCAAMLAIYVATGLVIWLVFGMVSGMISRVRLEGFDRQLGGVFGAVKGVLWCVVITFFAVTLSEPTRQAVLKSRSGYYIAVLTQRAAPLLPREVRSWWGSTSKSWIGIWIRTATRRRRRSCRCRVRERPAAGRPEPLASAAGRESRCRFSREIPDFRPNIRDIIGRWKGAENKEQRRKMKVEKAP